MTTSRNLLFCAVALLAAMVCHADAPAAYYVDSRAGSNENPGTSADAPWKDFTNINGKILGPGEKLLIKRGSVISQELLLGAQGTTEAWAEVGAYGEGARPLIRRNWDIRERCALVGNPDYLRISGLTFAYAGKGLVVHFGAPGHGNVVIEDCVAHHIEGIYREWGNLSGIPSWMDFKVPAGDGLYASAGIAVTGRGHDITIRDCDLFQISWGFWVAGERVHMDRVNVHDCYRYNTAPHPAAINLVDSVMENCVFDAPGYHAFAGTMGIMLGGPRNLTIRNCTFKNQPDSGSHDEGGIDFEAGGDGCLIDGCTFENNAGAAIEVLGLQNPQAKNVEIRNTRFIKNNWANKLGPSEIFIWGAGTPKPEIACSTGTIHDNGYVLAPGVKFFVNQAPDTTEWKLANNTAYDSVATLEAAMPWNRPPVVEAGDGVVTSGTSVALKGTVSDAGQPAIRWEALEGPGPVTFAPADAAATNATFGAPGEYLLRLHATDGELFASDVVHVAVLPPKVSVLKSWEFNGVLDKEGWTEENLGTKDISVPDVGVAKPVKYVAGGHYIVCVDQAPDAVLVSPDGLGIPLAPDQCVVLLLQNHTDAKEMSLTYVTDEGEGTVHIAVHPMDTRMRGYLIEPGWSGSLRQLRLGLTGGAPATGTVRIDAVRILYGR